MTWNWNNISTTHQRWMMTYLRKRGWVVFYLEPQARTCVPGQPMGCWLQLYKESEARELKEFVSHYLGDY